MDKKASKRQLAIVSLSDYNQKQIDDLRQEQHDMTAQFQKKKEGRFEWTNYNENNDPYYKKMMTYAVENPEILKGGGEAICQPVVLYRKCT